MKGQALLADALLALSLALLISQVLVAPSFEYSDTSGSLKMDRAGYDLVNYIYSDEEFYTNVTSCLAKEGRITNSSLFLLRQRMVYYGKVLELNAIDFEVVGIQKEHISVEERTAVASEKYCFPLVAGNGTRVFTGCMTVWI